MTTISSNYAATSEIIITLENLASGAYRQSDVVDNSVDLFIDAMAGGSIQGASPSSNALIQIFAYGLVSDVGTPQVPIYTGGASGTNSDYTADGEENLLKLLEVIVVDTTANQDYVWGPVSIANAFGGMLPREWGIIVFNDSGQNLNSTGTNNGQFYTGIKFDNA